VLVGVSKKPPALDKLARAPFPKSGSELAVASLVSELLESLAGSKAEVESIGVGTIGPVDAKRGAVIGAPNAPIKSFALKEPLEERFKTSVVVQNDCVAAAWGERVFGEGRAYEDFAYITISTGIGGGFVLGGRLVVGRRGNAHEVGHVVVDWRSRLRCGCGGYGHWEALASGSRVGAYLAELAKRLRLPKTEFLSLARSGKASYRELFDYAKKSDEAAKRLLESLMKVHAAGVASAVAAYDPEAVFLGGGVFVAHKRAFLGALKRRLRSYAIFRDVRLKAATFGYEAVLVGALALAYDPPRTC